MGIIEVEGMEFYAYHGCFDAENVVGNKFLVDLRMVADCDTAADSDDIKDALSYQKAYELVKEQMMISSHLLEHVAKRILDSLFENFDELEEAMIKVSKLNPPMGGRIQKTSITLTRQKEYDI